MARLGRARRYPPIVKRGLASAGLTAGTAALVSSGPGGIALTVGNATGGTPSYTYSWYRSVNGGSYNQLFNGGGVSGATSQALTDGSATVGNTYAYKSLAEDSALAQSYSNAVGPLVLYTGGTPTGGGPSRARFQRGM